MANDNRNTSSGIEVSTINNEQDINTSDGIEVSTIFIPRFFNTAAGIMIEWVEPLETYGPRVWMT